MPVAWVWRAGAPAGLVALLIASGGCAWVDSIRLSQPPPSVDSLTPSPPRVDTVQRMYVVRSGDTLSVIGQRSGLSVHALAQANSLKDPNSIAVGQTLVIPNAQTLPAVAARPSRAGRMSAPPPATVPDPPHATRTALDASLRSANDLLRAARFEDALAETERTRPSLETLDARADPSASALRVRLEILSATALVALGRGDLAQRSFERALQADPELVLDPAQVSPKIIRGLEEARRRVATRSPADASQLADGWLPP